MSIIVETKKDNCTELVLKDTFNYENFNYKSYNNTSTRKCEDCSHYYLKTHIRWCKIVLNDEAAKWCYTCLYCITKLEALGYKIEQTNITGSYTYE
jgi:hypothetical protein